MEPQRRPQAGDKYIVRFPDGMREQIAAAARANNRSINSEIVARLQASLAEPDEANVKPALEDVAQRLNRLVQLIDESAFMNGIKADAEKPAQAANEKGAKKK